MDQYTPQAPEGKQLLFCNLCWGFKHDDEHCWQRQKPAKLAAARHKNRDNYELWQQLRQTSNGSIDTTATHHETEWAPIKSEASDDWVPFQPDNDSDESEGEWIPVDINHNEELERMARVRDVVHKYKVRKATIVAAVASAVIVAAEAQPLTATTPPPQPTATVRSSNQRKGDLRNHPPRPSINNKPIKIRPLYNKIALRLKRERQRQLQFRRQFGIRRRQQHNNPPRRQPIIIPTIPPPNQARTPHQFLGLPQPFYALNRSSRIPHRPLPPGPRRQATMAAKHERKQQRRMEKQQRKMQSKAAKQERKEQKKWERAIVRSNEK